MCFKKPIIPFLLFFTGISLMMVSCKDNGTGSLVCTAEFVTINLQIENVAGEPVENADISVINAETGAALSICESFECNNGLMGQYVIFHDGFMEEVSYEGDPYFVNGEVGDATFSENFVFAKDRCHVFKKSGPDTVTVN